MIWELPSWSSGGGGGGDGFGRGDENVEDGEGEGDEGGLVEAGEGRLRLEAFGGIAAAAAPTTPPLEG